MNKNCLIRNNGRIRVFEAPTERSIYGCSAIIVSLMKLIGIFNIDAIRGGGKLFVQNRSIGVGAQNLY